MFEILFSNFVQIKLKPDTRSVKFVQIQRGGSWKWYTHRSLSNLAHDLCIHLHLLQVTIKVTLCLFLKYMRFLYYLRSTIYTNKTFFKEISILLLYLIDFGMMSVSKLDRIFFKIIKCFYSHILSIYRGDLPWVSWRPNRICTVLQIWYQRRYFWYIRETEGAFIYSEYWQLRVIIVFFSVVVKCGFSSLGPCTWSE